MYGGIVTGYEYSISIPVRREKTQINIYVLEWLHSIILPWQSSWC